MLEIWAKGGPKPWNMHIIQGVAGRGVPNLSHACPAGKGSLETRQKEKRDPNDADDAGQGGQHHQHHWGSVSPFLASHAPNDPSLVKIVSHPKLPLGLGASFQNGPCS